MGMIDESAGPGMKNRKQSDLPAHIAYIGCQFHKRQGCRLHEQGVSDLLMRFDDGMQLFGERKDGVKVRNRQAFFFSFFQPDFSIRFMAGGAASVFAGMIGITHMLTGIADEGMAAHDVGATVDDIRNRFPMAGQKGLSESFQVRKPVGPENLRDAGHDRYKSANRLLRVSVSFWKLLSVRWV